MRQQIVKKKMSRKYKVAMKTITSKNMVVIATSIKIYRYEKRLDTN